MSDKHQADELLPLSELAKRLPAVRGRKPPNRTTLYRWATVGLKSRSGRRIRLQTTFVGGTLCASLADVERLSAQKDDRVPIPREPTSMREEQRMRRRAEAARKELRAMGILKAADENQSIAL
jgi:hypothetical protein